jgi:hypothetical protein
MRTLMLVILLAATAGCTKKSLQEEWEDVIAVLPWMMDVLNYCENYKSVKAQADKNDLTTMCASHVKNSEAKAVQGEIEKLLLPTEEKPDEIALQILIGNRVRFATQSKERPLKKGDKVFEQVSGMKQGDCVVVSANDFVPIATFQQGQVCDPRYYARFSDIQACP